MIHITLTHVYKTQFIMDRLNSVNAGPNTHLILLTRIQTNTSINIQNYTQFFTWITLLINLEWDYNSWIKLENPLMINLYCRILISTLIVFVKEWLHKITIQPPQNISVNVSQIVTLLVVQELMAQLLLTY